MPRPGGRRGQLAGALAVHLGLGRVTEPQFDARRDLVLQRGPQFGPPRGRHHHCTPYDRPREAIAVIGPSRLSNSWRSVAQPSTTRNTSPNGSSTTSGSRSASRAIFGHRIDAQAPKACLACPHHRLHHRDRATAQVGVGPAGHRADVRQSSQRRQRSAAEVEAVEADLRGACVVGRVPAATCAAPSTCLTVARRRPRHCLPPRPIRRRAGRDVVRRGCPPGRSAPSTAQAAVTGHQDVERRRRGQRR